MKIDREKLKKVSAFGYTSLMPDMLFARVRVRVGSAEVSGVLEWNEDLGYPLMRLER